MEEVLIKHGLAKWCLVPESEKWSLMFQVRVQGENQVFTLERPDTLSGQLNLMSLVRALCWWCPRWNEISFRPADFDLGYSLDEKPKDTPSIDTGYDAPCWMYRGGPRKYQPDHIEKVIAVTTKHDFWDLNIWGINLGHLKTCTEDKIYNSQQYIMQNGFGDYKDLRSWVTLRGNKNFINIQEEWYFGEPRVSQLLKMCVPVDSGDELYTEKLETGVLLLNNLLAYHICSPKSGNTIVKKVAIVDPVDRELTYQVQWTTISEIRQYLGNQIFFCVKPSERHEPNAKKQKTNWADVWHTHPLRAQTTSVSFIPYSLISPPFNFLVEEGPYIKDRAINTFAGYNVTLDDLNAAFMDPAAQQFIDDFKRIIYEGLCSTRASGDFLLDWLAFIVQRPEQKSLITTIIKTQKGIGKSFLSRIMRTIFRSHYYYLNGAKINRFNSFLANKKFVVFDETSSLDANILKSITTEQTISIERKGHDQFQDINLTEILLCTNDDVGMPITQDNRRFFVDQGPHKSQSELADWVEWGTGVYTRFFPPNPKVESIGPKVIFYFLLRRSLVGWKTGKQAPSTSYTQQLMEKSLSAPMSWWKFCLQKRQFSMLDQEGVDISGRGIRAGQMWEHFIDDHNFWDRCTIRKNSITQSFFLAEMSSCLTGFPVKPKSVYHLPSWDECVENWNRNNKNLTI